MTIKPFNNIGEVRALIGTGRRVKWRMSTKVAMAGDNLTILAIGTAHVFVSNEDGLEFTIPRYNILNYYGVEVPEEYVYVNVYRRFPNGPLYTCSSTESRAEADLNAADNMRVGCLKIRLEERFDE